MRRVLLLLLIPTLACAQAPSIVTGTVQAAGTAEKIPFAVVEIPTRHLGVQADQEGYLSLSLPFGLTSSDSLTVSALGYQRRRVAMSAASRIMLQPLPITLREVVVHGTKAAPVVLGPQEKVGSSGGFGQSGLTTGKGTGWQVARFFAQPPTGQLTAVRFYVKPSTTSHCARQLLQAPFRVRVCCGWSCRRTGHRPAYGNRHVYCAEAGVADCRPHFFQSSDRDCWLLCGYGMAAHR
ncbi:carboxypeptidase-like regulatory domain-containing protein [Hymenobacter profundi]|uniref:Carboxypeptidase-like regulatory domain-containing protein n=1 Tax=Hymenobacter profundi TaxID=1982110 RepID=A0ABS6WYL6_9BACT|nr:carboxypeptidase-like regulatory domain-containing protein [Hymenobacter profundi]MBW3128126.1 carboxypeptidase-like regulatory domain-containing protein [Hymenobacter profundi]